MKMRHYKRVKSLCIIHLHHLLHLAKHDDNIMNTGIHFYKCVFRNNIPVVKGISMNKSGPFIDVDSPNQHRCRAFRASAWCYKQEDQYKQSRSEHLA